MKMILKFLQYIFKFLARILSKLGAKYIYIKFFKSLMKYKIISIIYSPLKYLFSNLIYFIKLTSAIISIFSLFNLSIIYYDFDIMNEINDLINNFINYIKVLYNKWLSKEDEIPEPTDFLTSRKEIKVIGKTIQNSPNNSYWILPLMLIGYGVIYYYNPHVNLNEQILPVIDKIEDNIPSEFPTIFVAGTVIYKFITISISYITGFKLDIFDDNNEGNNPLSNNKGKKKYSPIDELIDEEKDDYKSSFSDDEDINTPKQSTSALPENSIKNPPYIENPFNKIKFSSESQKSNEIKIEDWD